MKYLRRLSYGLALLMAVSTTAQPAEGLSPSLAKAVADQVKIDVSLLDAETLAAIDVLKFEKQAGIEYTGLELFTNLHELHMTNHSLSDLGFLADLKTLKILSLRDNRISDLKPLAGLSNLTNLNLSNNLVEKLYPLSKLTGLTHLDIANNAVRNLRPLSTLTNLRTLNAASNRIDNLAPLVELPNLKHITLSGNTITHLSPLAKTDGLMFLDVSENRIEQLDPLSSLKNLTYLDVTGNPVNSLKPVAQLTRLTVLRVRTSAFKGDLTPLAALSNLERLDAPHSDVRSINALADLTKLRRLDLSHNRITDIAPLASVAKTLTNVNLEANPLSVESRGTHLRTLREKVKFEGDPVKSPRVLSNNFEKVDLDKNKALSYAEAKKAYPPLSVLEFDALDADKDWQITRAELFDLVRALPDSLDIAWLGPDRSGKGLGTKENPFRSFREAQLALKDGGTLMLHPGARVDTKALKKTLVIESRTISRATRKPASQEDSPAVKRQPAQKITPKAIPKSKPAPKKN